MGLSADWSFIEKTSLKQSIKLEVCSKRQTDPLLINEGLQSPTTQGQYDLLRNQHISMADGPLPIDLRLTEPDDTI